MLLRGVLHRLLHILVLLSGSWGIHYFRKQHEVADDIAFRADDDRRDGLVVNHCEPDEVGVFVLDIQAFSQHMPVLVSEDDAHLLAWEKMDGVRRARGVHRGNWIRPM